MALLNRQDLWGHHKVENRHFKPLEQHERSTTLLAADTHVAFSTCSACAFLADSLRTRVNQKRGLRLSTFLQLYQVAQHGREARDSNATSHKQGWPPGTGAGKSESTAYLHLYLNTFGSK